ncbi:MAG: GNAT family N-acetyltransferase [Alphaproteobacteria bacterium]|nr:GNAT family N-acetyltransferase [Alphaproteobacteria bacterium]
MKDITYKVISWKDAEAVYNLGKNVEADLDKKNLKNFFSSPTQEELVKLLDGSTKVIAAFENAELVGFMLYRNTTSDTFRIPYPEEYGMGKIRKSISKVSVRPDYQRMGIGTEMYKYLFENIYDSKYEELMLDCSVQNLGTISNISKMKRPFYLKGIDDWGKDEGLFFTFFLNLQNYKLEKKEFIQELVLDSSFMNQPFDYQFQQESLSQVLKEMKDPQVLGKIKRLDKNSVLFEISKYLMTYKEL